MFESKRQPEQPTQHTINMYTPENIKGLGYDSHLQDALFLLRLGISEITDMDGVESSSWHRSNYDVAVKDETTIEFWESELRKGKELGAMRDPFLLVDSNIQTGVVGVLEGRMYAFPRTQEDAMFINWITTKNSGANDGDYSYRGRQVGKKLLEEAEKAAKSKNLSLLIAGVNPANTASARLFEKAGFVKESFSGTLSPEGKQLAHRTENGAFIPPFPFKDVNSTGQPVEGVVEFWTKRLFMPQDLKA